MFDDCWIYPSTTWNGYGYTVIDGWQVRTHRVAYEILVGPIPDGMVLDHLCRNRACYNPHHLQPVTELENILRGTGRAALNARKTRCLRGHPLEGENLILTAAGSRQCRTCRKARELVSGRRRRAARRSAGLTAEDEMPFGPCPTCGRGKRLVAKGLCSACYQRSRRAVRGH